MINKIIVLLLIVLSILGLGGYKEDSYYRIEQKVKKSTEFVENGVRLEYKSNLTLEEEIKTIKKTFKDYNTTEEKNNLNFYGKYNIEVRVWNEEKITYVSATILNRESNNETIEMRNELKKLESKNSASHKYFEFYKGDLNKNININEALELLDIKNSEILKIENGYTGRIELGKDNVNFGLVNYDTGLQLIIGTPVIFTTY